MASAQLSYANIWKVRGIDLHKEQQFGEKFGNVTLVNIQSAMSAANILNTQNRRKQRMANSSAMRVVTNAVGRNAMSVRKHLDLILVNIQLKR